MIKDYKEEHDLIRKELWVKVACAYVSASNSTSVDGAAKWADKVVSDFDKRFKNK